MSLDRELQQRSGSKCELCNSEEKLTSYSVPDIKEKGLQTVLYACNVCTAQMNDADAIDPNHWRCLNTAVWSEIPAVQVMSARMLKRLAKEHWAEALLEETYFEEEVEAWIAAAE